MNADIWVSKFNSIDDVAYRPKPFSDLEEGEGNEIAIGLRSEMKWINPKEEDIQKISDEMGRFKSDLKSNIVTHSFGYPIFKLKGI